MQMLRQSYFFDAGVKTLGVSDTMHGISNKLLLVGTLSDQVTDSCFRCCLSPVLGLLHFCLNYGCCTSAPILLVLYFLPECACCLCIYFVWFNCKVSSDLCITVWFSLYLMYGAALL